MSLLDCVSLPGGKASLLYHSTVRDFVPVCCMIAGVWSGSELQVGGIWMIWAWSGGLKELDDPGCSVRRSPILLVTRSSDQKLTPLFSLSLKLRYKDTSRTINARPSLAELPPLFSLSHLSKMTQA